MILRIGRVDKLKSVLRAILEFPLVGRPLRKLFWLFYKCSLRVHQLAILLLNKHPYIQKLDRNGKGAAVGSDESLLRYYRNLRASIATAPYQPRISIIIPVYKVKIQYLDECLRSVEAQAYSNWEACIVDDCSEDPEIEALISLFAKKHGDKVKFQKNAQNMHISRTSNVALKLATGEYVAFFDHDDRLLPNALGEVVRFINLHNKPDVLYSDECTINEKGEVLVTYMKPDWSPLMHLAVNYTTHFSVYRKSLIEEVGGCRQGFEGSQDHDLMLRVCERTKKDIVHIPINIYQWRAHQMSTANSGSAKPYAAIAGCKAVSEACVRRGYPADVRYDEKYQRYKVKFHLPTEPDMVSLVILSRDGYDLVKPCLDSIFQKSTYQNFEVLLVDHETRDQRCLDLFAEYTRLFPTKFKVIPFSGPFNFAKMNNLAVNQARGKFLVLMNNDVEIITESWLEEMLGIAQLPNIGAVGPKLLYPNRRIQHAGLVGRGTWVAGHSGIGCAEDTFDYFSYHQTTHEALGVTGACLMISRENYLKAGGLEEFFVPNGFGDVDICLKLREMGLSNVYVPYAQLYHKESVTRKQSFELFEKYFMIRKWAKDLLYDPYRHIAFKVGNHFIVEDGFRVQEPSIKLFNEILKNPEMI